MDPSEPIKIALKRQLNDLIWDENKPLSSCPLPYPKLSWYKKKPRSSELGAHIYIPRKLKTFLNSSGSLLIIYEYVYATVIENYCLSFISSIRFATNSSRKTLTTLECELFRDSYTYVLLSAIFKIDCTFAMIN